MSENDTQKDNNKKINDEKENRKEKLKTLREIGINPYPNNYDVTYKAKDIVNLMN